MADTRAKALFREDVSDEADGHRRNARKQLLRDAQDGTAARLGRDRAKKIVQGERAKVARVVVDAVKELACGRPHVYFRGERLRRKAACQKLLETWANRSELVEGEITAGHAVLLNATARKLLGREKLSLGTLMSHSKPLSSWTRTEATESSLDPRVQAYRQAKRDARPRKEHE